MATDSLRFSIMQVDASFPGGNVQIHVIEGDHIRFGPDNRDTLTGWFYWCFRVRGAMGRTLHFHPCRKNLMTSLAPAVSIDQGRSWTWLDRSCVQSDDSFIVTIPQNADDWRVCMTIPYTQQELNAFAERHAGRWQTDTLCRTDKGSDVALWRIGQDIQQARHRVFVAARHHCCESMANYVIEGLIEAALQSDETGLWWQKHVSLTVVPFVDWDGVWAGDQGKNRHPRDHNRDYDGQPIYPQTPAIMQEVRRQASLGLDAVLDIHCPWIHGLDNEEIYMVGQESPENWQRQEQLAEHLAVAAAKGPLPYNPLDNIAFGQRWNKPNNFTGGRSFASWACSQQGVGLSSSFEIPYALARKQIMTADNVRKFGGQLARALKQYMASSPVDSSIPG